MKYINARKIIFLSLMAAFSFCLFSCKEAADSLLEIDSAHGKINITTGLVFVYQMKMKKYP